MNKKCSTSVCSSKGNVYQSIYELHSMALFHLQSSTVSLLLSCTYQKTCLLLCVMILWKDIWVIKERLFYKMQWVKIFLVCANGGWIRYRNFALTRMEKVSLEYRMGIVLFYTTPCVRVMCTQYYCVLRVMSCDRIENFMKAIPMHVRVAIEREFLGLKP